MEVPAEPWWYAVLLAETPTYSRLFLPTVGAILQNATSFLHTTIVPTMLLMT